ncbi:MAG: hypothetical protein KDA21_13305 [Phycisphaerales bacterium]|nr:hypothetical protein [Phycisphaerales bacterium]
MNAATTHPAPPAAMPLAALEALSASELAEVMRMFNDACSRLQQTHESLQHEVVRLQGELAETRQQLRRARELAALGEMAAGISHEIRNPLGSIRLYAGMLLDDLADRPEQRDVVRRIDLAVARMNDIVHDVLDFARELHVSGCGVSGAELLRDAVESCRDLIDEAGIAVLSPREDHEVLADPALMHQALLNVIRNAAEALAESGVPEPQIRLDLVARSLLDPSGRRRPMVGLVVIDNGPGLPPDVADRLFQPFFTTRHTGTGLGLAIVHRILDAHGGRIALTSPADDVPRLIARGDDPACPLLPDGQRPPVPEPRVDEGACAVRRGTRVELILPVPSDPTSPTGDSE